MIFLLFILAVVGSIGLIWGVLFLRHCGIFGYCLLMMLLGCVFGHPFFHVGPITLDRVLLMGLVGLMALLAIKGLTPRRRISKPDIACVMLIGYLVCSTMSGDWKRDGAFPASILAFCYFLPFLFYWVVRSVRLTERHFDGMLWALAIFGLYLAVTGLLEMKQIYAAVFPRYITDPSYVEFLGRGRGPFLNPVGNGIYMCTCLGATILLWLRAHIKLKLFLPAIAAVICLGVGSTLTRSTWLGAGLVIFVSTALLLPKRLRLPLIFGLMMISVVVVAVKWDSLTSFKRDTNVSESDMRESAKLRPILAAVAWQMFRDRPIMGVGFGQYKEFDGEYYYSREFDLPLEKARPYIQHNVFLSLLTETGLVGLSLFVLMLAMWAVDGWRLWRCSAAPDWARQLGLLFLLVLFGYLPNTMFHEVSYIVMVNMLLFFFAGMTRGVLQEFEGVPQPAFRSRRSDEWSGVAGAG